MPQNSMLNCNNKQSFRSSLMDITSLSPDDKAWSCVPRLWLCIRQPATMINPPLTDLRSKSSQAQSPSR